MKIKFFIQTQLWLFLLLLLNGSTSLQAQRPFPAGLPTCLETDFRQLERFYDSTNGNNWLNQANWFTANMASWYGIGLTADNCHVRTINLVGNRLNGSIPTLNLPNLQYLSLDSNQLTGTIPNFNSFATLETLRLSSNQLIGTIPNFNLPNLNFLTLNSNQLEGCIPDSLRFRCPLIRENGFINNNPNLSTQSWSAYWNYGSGSCSRQTVSNGGTISSALCGDRDFRLPSGRIINAAGIYADTVRSVTAADDIAYQVQVNRDTTCHCQDSVALASFYHSSGGYPNYWDLRQPMNTWAGLSFNAQGCVITSWDARPDTPICTQLNQNYVLYADFGLFNALQFSTQWSKNGVIRADTGFLLLRPFQRADTGRYTSRMLVNGQFSMLPKLQYADSRTMRLKLCCQASRDSVVRTIQQDSCWNWAGVNRCLTGIYRDTIFDGSYTGCDSIRILDLRVQPCNLRASVELFGNDFYANATSAVPITTFRWSNGATTQNVSLRTSGSYSVTVTDTMRCVSTASRPFTFDPTLQYEHYSMNSSKLTCAGAGITTILLNAPLRDGLGYTVRINYDSSKIQPQLGTRSKYLMPNPDSAYLFENVVNGNRFVLHFGPSGFRNMSGNIGDTLVQIHWLAKGNARTTPMIPVQGWVEETIGTRAGHATYTVNGQLLSCVTATNEITECLSCLHPQAPQGLNYQAVARNAQGQPLVNQILQTKFSILQDSATGATLYAETHTAITNVFGLYSLIIGQGTVILGDFPTIKWFNGRKFLKVEINNSWVGTMPFWSVPYVLYAKNGSQWSDNAIGIHYSAAKVGIGTSTPKNKLTIVGANTLNPNPNDGSLLHLSDLSTTEQAATTLELANSGTGISLFRHTSPNYTVINNLKNFMDIATLFSNGIMIRSNDPQSSIRFGVGTAGPVILERLVIDSTGFVGIGTSRPKAQLQVKGRDVFIEDVNRGVILKSPNGSCWRMTVSDAGQPIYTTITCPN
jgi:hypothetical protein